MCDTVCSLADNNEDSRVTLFGKNSDRDPNETQVVEYHPREMRDGKVRATYIEVEYEGKTNSAILSRPNWMWGAEMGLNEKGVAAGNEAIFSHPKNRRESLLGMDLLRLGLEKGDDARSVVDTMILYSETYGQGGSNDQFKGEYYDNLFLVADFKEAFELTLVGKEYSLKKVHSHDSISNKIPILTAEERRELKKSSNFSYKEDYIYTKFGRGKERSRFSSEALQDRSNALRLQDIFRLLRHHEGGWPHPREGSNRDVCMHAGPLSRRFQTVNSMVVELTENRSVAWSTFSSNPCISLYKPVLFSGERVLGLNYGSDYWVRSEAIHRNYVDSGSSFNENCSGEVDKMQAEIIDLTADMRGQWLFGDGLSPRIEENVFTAIRDIDDRNISSLQTKAEAIHSNQSIGLYGSWWRRKGKGLYQTS